MKRRGAAGVVLAGFGLLSGACGGVSKQQEVEQHARTPGDRVLLLVARGYKPRRLSVTLEANRDMNVGEVLLEPAASYATPAP